MASLYLSSISAEKVCRRSPLLLFCSSSACCATARAARVDSNRNLNGFERRLFPKGTRPPRDDDAPRVGLPEVVVPPSSHSSAPSTAPSTANQRRPETTSRAWNASNDLLRSTDRVRAEPICGENLERFSNERLPLREKRSPPGDKEREREKERKKERKKEEDRRERVINSRSVRRLKLELFATLRVVSFRVRFPFLLPSVVFDHALEKVFASARLDVFFFLLFKGFA